MINEPGIRKSIIERISRYVEYVLILLVILECNSPYTKGVTDYSTNMYRVFYFLSVILIVFDIAILCFAYPSVRELKKNCLITTLLMLVVTGCFYCLNVRKTAAAASKEYYILLFMIILPLLTVLFAVKRKLGRIDDLILKHSDIVYFIAVINLIVYVSNIIDINSTTADLIQNRWAGEGYLSLLCNYLNICIVRPGIRWQMLGIPYLRNYGIFMEPIVFCIPLATALFSEMFLRNEKSHTKVIRWLILSVVIVTAQSTLGLLLCAFAWGIRIIKYVWKLKKGRSFTIGAIVLVVIISAALIHSKQEQYYQADEVASNSTQEHLEDYSFGIKAFLRHPLVGGGYDSLEPIRAEMSESRLARNKGVSNSITTVFGQGGLLLGLLCLLPFIICLSKINSKEYHQFAMWILGPLLLYCGSVMFYHLTMVFFLCIGYALIIPMTVEEAEPIQENITDKRMYSPKITAFYAISLLLTGCIIIALSVKCNLLNQLHIALARNGLLLGQSKLNALFLAIIVLLHVAYILDSYSEKSRTSSIRALPYAVFDIIFIYAFPFLNNSVVTMLSITRGWSELTEAVLLFALYAIGIILITFLQSIKKLIGTYNISGRLILLSFVAFVALIGTGIILVGLKIDKRVESIRSRVNDLKVVTENSSGHVFITDTPLLYFLADHSFDFSAADRIGYATYENASIIVDSTENYRELFDAGFELTKLNDKQSVYTNDPALIQALQDRDYAFYRYYPYEKKVALRRAASRNNLAMTEDGIILSGEGQPLINGPYDKLKRGQYTVIYDLKINKESLSTDPDSSNAIGRLQVCCRQGNMTLGQKEITTNDFSSDGIAQISIPFTVDSPDQGITDFEYFEYRLYPYKDNELVVNNISLSETPDYLTTYVYDSHRNTKKESYYNIDSSSYVNPKGYSSIEYAYNSDDTVLSKRFIDAKNNPIITRDGYAQIMYTYNDKRKLSGEYYYGTDGTQIKIRAGYSGISYDYDDYGNTNVIRYIDDHRVPVRNLNGYAEIRRVFNSRRQVVKEEYYSTENKRAITISGYSAYENSYDDNGFLVTRTFLDEHDEPVITVSGFSEIKYVYNDRNQTKEEEYFNTDGERTFNNIGCAIVKREYDVKNNIVEEKYYDEKNDPAPCNAGYAIIRRSFNDNNQNIYESYYDTDGDPITCVGGYFGIIREYYDDGSIENLIYVDENGSPMTNSSKIAYLHYQYNQQGLVDSEEYMDINLNPCCNSAGIHKVRKQYNDLGQLIKETYYSLDDEPLVRGEYVSIARDYDYMNRVMSMSYLNTDDYNVPNPSGVYFENYVYDNLNNRVVTTYSDMVGAKSENSSGITEIKSYYNERRRCVLEQYYDNNGVLTETSSGYCGVFRVYDEIGNLIEINYLDKDMELQNNAEGIATIRREFDRIRNCIFEYYYDCDGIPAKNSSGYISVTREYDEFRNLLLLKGDIGL